MVVLVLTKDIVHRDEPLFFSSFLFFLFLGWDGSFLSSCLMVVGGCFWLRRVLLHSLSTYTLLIVPDPHHACLHVPPQKGMPFFFRKTPAQPHSRTHTHKFSFSLFRLFFFFPSLRRCFILVHHRCPQRLTPSVPLYCTAGGVEKLEKKFKPLEHEAEKKKRKERKKGRGKISCFRPHPPRGGGGWTTQEIVTRTWCQRMLYSCI